MTYAWQKGVPRTAGTGRRIAAFAIDSAIVFALAWTLTFSLAAAGALRIPDIELSPCWPPTCPGVPSPAAGLLYAVSIFELPLLLAYFTLLEGLLARTPGKMLLGLRVRRLDERAPSLFDAFLRNLLRLLWVTPLGPAFILLDAWSLGTSELDQRMGDLAAETLVLDERLEQSF